MRVHAEGYYFLALNYRIHVALGWVVRGPAEGGPRGPPHLARVLQVPHHVRPALLGGQTSILLVSQPTYVMHTIYHYTL